MKSQLETLCIAATSFYEHFSPDRREPYFEPLGLPRGMACGSLVAYQQACVQQLTWLKTMRTLRAAQGRDSK